MHNKSTNPMASFLDKDFVIIASKMNVDALSYAYKIILVTLHPKHTATYKFPANTITWQTLAAYAKEIIQKF